MALDYFVCERFAHEDAKRTGSVEWHTVASSKVGPTKMTITCRKMFLGSTARPMREANNLTVICEPNV
jgi:hypothetical protein